ncbi:GDYXXLXY domain-containing protein [Flavobacterium akiainvivens]|uniref:GDYXXLXY domain-containing protein n=1 Tax=Flavobacterium akiainvivens TaxID=1202724 RepID=UPI0006C876A5|nr:GDYXXLXY domain-containing protein [Flavobacterium akiainvivens]SFQ69898.1 Uncharacterized membrane-anchored protein [Flavobacterium akiainvivens]
MKTKYALIAFAVTALAQLFIPARMVYSNHIVETEGIVYKFRAEPVDPADPFRGRYITLNFVADTFAIANFYDEGEAVYALLGKDADGFAKIKNVTFTVPKSGDYIKVDKWSYYKYFKTLNLELPFDRYYMEESKAPEAELLYAEYLRDNTKALPAYGEVAVKDGNAVLKRVIINGMPVEEYVQQNRP